jgi:hypothetical protein
LTTESPKRLRDIAAEIDRTEPSAHCQLVPADECRALIDSAARLPANTAPDDASRMARTMIGVYPRADVLDPETYVTAIAGTLAQFPPHVSQKVADPINGLPGRLKFLPRVAEVREACEAEAQRQRTIVARARWMIQEHEARAKREAPVKRTLTPEQVDELVKGFGKANNITPTAAA